MKATLCVCLLLVLPGVCFASTRTRDPDNEEQYEDEASEAAEEAVEEEVDVGPTVGQQPKPSLLTVAHQEPSQDPMDDFIKDAGKGPNYHDKEAQEAHKAAFGSAQQADPVKVAEEGPKSEDKQTEKVVAEKVVDQEAEKTITAAVPDSKMPEYTVAVSDNTTQAAIDSSNAHVAAETAMHAAKVANTVAVHSVKVIRGSQAALKKAQNAIHEARVDTSDLSDEQKESLKKAEAKLKEATKRAAYGEVKDAKYVKTKVENEKLQKMETKMDKIKTKKGTNKEELEAMREEIKELRKELKAKGGDPDVDAALKELEDDINEMEAAEKKGGSSGKSHDELKAELERLRRLIKDMEKAKEEDDEEAPEDESKPEEKKKTKPVKVKPVAPGEPVEKGGFEKSSEAPEAAEATPVESKGLDIDTAMPYGDLEPFGREDTAQELTEESISESDGMVDQMEKAEVAEEKRAVFRALTRLRGAAITSFDGVARSQTGNIDEYNKVHKWRNGHPLHHLADEESDVSKWAFPENAD